VQTLAFPSLFAPSPAAAETGEELEALREEIRQERQALADEREELSRQRERVDEALARLEQAQGLAPSEGVPIVNKAPQVQLDIYGFIHTDAIYDVNRVDPDWKAALRPSKIPIVCPGDAGCGNDGETVLSVRQSRLGVRALVPTPVGDIKTRFEFELFGVGDDAGETTFRLRHAYGELGPFGAGQTWSLFMDPDVFPNTIEYWGPVGMVFYRNVQVRYTPIEDESWRLAMAIESPGSALDEGKIDTDDLSPFGEGFSSWDRFPDVTAQVRHQGDWGHVQLAGIVRYLGFEIRSNNGDDPDGWELGYAGNLSGSFRLFENDKILWQIAGGRGFANYMNDGGTDLAPDDFPNPDAEAVPGIGWLLYYNRQWAERWTSSIGFSEHRQFTTGGQEDDAFETGQYGNVNLLFHPTPDMYVGPEFVWGRRENRDGADGTDSRVQISFHYDFGGTLIGRRD
jgi:hypothetical protein